MYHQKKTMILTILLYLSLTVLAVIMLFPYIWMLANSFRSSADIVSHPLSLFDGNFTLQAYRSIEMPGGRPITQYLCNSLIITICSVVLSLMICSLGSYALTRKPKLPGFRVTMAFFLVSIMYPWALLVIPLYTIVFNLGLLGTHIGIILAITGGTGIALPVFIFLQFFKSIPYEVIEYADVEGASEFTILMKIVIPMARPVYTTVALITFMTNWGEWFYVMVLSNTMDTATLPVALMNSNSELGVELNSIMALASVISVPVIILFVFTQRRVMEGIAQGSVKG